MKLNKLFATGFTLLALALPFASHALTANPQGMLNDVGTATGQSAVPLPALVGNFINVLLGFLGILVFVYFFYAGFLWMTSAGEQKKVDSAKSIIKNATIGTLILLAAYTISAFVVGSLVNATGAV